MKKFDIFPKSIDNELKIKTNFGGTFTLIIIIFLIINLMNEFKKYFKKENIINLNINQKKLPNFINYELEMFIFNECNNLHLEFTNQKRTFELEVNNSNEFKQIENFCLIKSKGKIPTVPGSFHIGLGETYFNEKEEHSHLFLTLKNKNLSHKINYLKFGEINSFNSIDNSNLNLLKNNIYMINYNIQLININNLNKIGFYLITTLSKTNLEKIRSKGLSGIIFEWNFSPLELNNLIIKIPFINLISNLLAIFGSFFILIKWFDIFLFKLIKK